MLHPASVTHGYFSEIFASFQGEGLQVGRRHLFVRTAGCNIRCTYCDTPDSLERTAGMTIFYPDQAPEQRDNPITGAELQRIISTFITQDAPIDAIAITGGEPLVQSAFLATFLRDAALPVPVMLETNGTLPRRLAHVLPYVDIISMDIKPPSNTGEKSFWEAHTDFLQAACTREVYIKILVDQATTESDLRRAAALICDIAPDTPTFLQPIISTDGRPDITPAHLTACYRLLHSRLPTVRVLPQTHKLLGIQ